MICTERLNLRQFTLDDLDFLYRLDNDKVVNRYRSTSVRTMEFCEGQINKWRNLYNTTEHNVYLIESKESKDSIGLVFLVKSGPVYFLGYRLLESNWRKGYAFEACQQMLKGHFRVSPEPVYAETHPNNEASIHLLIKLGFEEITEKNQYDSRLFVQHSLTVLTC